MECNTLIVCAHHTAHTYVVPKVPDGVFTECCASCTHTNTHHMKRSILTSSCRCRWRCGLTLQIVPKIAPIAVLHGHTGRRETLSHTHTRTHARTHVHTHACMHTICSHCPRPPQPNDNTPCPLRGLHLAAHSSDGTTTCASYGSNVNPLSYVTITCNHHSTQECVASVYM